MEFTQTEILGVLRILKYDFMGPEMLLEVVEALEAHGFTIIDTDLLEEIKTMARNSPGYFDRLESSYLRGKTT